MSSLSHYFSKNKFCVLIEYLGSTPNQFAVKTVFSDFPALLTLADRVHSDQDISPLDASFSYPPAIDKVLHFAGKDRDIQDFEKFLDQANAANIQNLLLLTGDKLKNHVDKEVHLKRTRYLESVNAVIAAKQRGGFNIGVAFNPFKYTQAEHDAQYFKLHKKVKAGADFIIMQLGYDLEALQHCKQFMHKHDYTQKLLACVMPLSLARAKFMLKHKVAGIVITPHILNVLEDEKKSGNTECIYKRCALQILICKQLGFAGIHLSACHHPDEQALVEHWIKEYRDLDLNALEILLHIPL